MSDLPIIACDLNAIQAEEHGGHLSLIDEWRRAVQEVVELPSGYAFRFAPETPILLGLAEFISRERLCCPFFHFEIAVEPNQGPLWLRLLGGEEVKDFVQESLVAE
jgi:hypothetical protein